MTSHVLPSLLAVALLGCGSTTNVLEEGAGGATGTGGCVSHAQCIDDDGQLPSLCREGMCVPALSADCTRVLGDVDHMADEHTVHLGVLAPLSGPGSATGEAQVSAVALALDELREVAGGVPVEGGSAPVVAIVCDEQAAAAATAHLVEDLGVQLVLGSRGADRLVDEVLPVALENGAMVLSPSADGPALPALEDQGLVWQAESVAAHGAAMARVAARIEDDLAPGTHRAVIVVGDDARSSAVGDALLAELMLNGQTAEQNVAGGTLLVLSAADGADVNAVAIVEHDPHLVLVAPSGPIGMIEAVEAQRSPSWIVGPPPPDGAGLPLGLDGRLFVVRAAPPLDREVHDAFAVRFASRSGDQPPFEAAEAYDAAWLGILALVAAGGPGANGEALAAATTRVAGGQGTALAVGPSDLIAALTVLQAGGSVDLEGTTGSLDADLATGSLPRSHEVLCAAPTLAASGLVIGEDGVLAGSSTCL